MAKKLHSFTVILIIFALLGSGCSANQAATVPRNAEIIKVTASTNLKTWLNDAASEFNTAKNESPQGKPYYIELTYSDTGEVITTGKTEGFLADMWIPDSLVWADLMADQGNSNYIDDCVSTSKSPLVIAMWKPIAESLGWPGRDLGWLDIGSLAADPSAWVYYSGGQFGPSLRLGHAHPGLSAAGTSTLLAVVHSAQSKQTAIEADEIEEPIVKASVSAFESSVFTFSSNTSALSELMQKRGIGYLDAAVVYENLVYEMGNQDPAIVPVYPYEGTFMANFPACVSSAALDNKRAGALLFRNYLTSSAGQALAFTHGLRSISPNNVAEIAQQDEKNNVNLSKSMTEFENPNIDTIYAIQNLWQSARKAVNLVMVIDTSGSMAGIKIESVIRAANEFVSVMGDNDYISVVAFDGQSHATSLVYHAQIEDARDAITQMINELEADGGTPLYDAIGLSTQLIAQSQSSATSNALVVLTDGKDTASKEYDFNQGLINAAIGNNTTIYTIAFGNDADEKVLSDLALQANGNFYLGDQTNIASIYKEMSVIFGGNMGIGR